MVALCSWVYCLLSRSYIINSNSPILALSFLASLQFTEDPPLLQQFSLLNKLPIFTSHGVENLGLAADQIQPELPLVIQAPERMCGFYLFIKDVPTAPGNKGYSASWFLTPCSEKISSHCTYKVFQVRIKVRNTFSSVCRQAGKMVEKGAAFIPCQPHLQVS